MKRPAPSMEFMPSATIPPMTQGSTAEALAYLSDASAGRSSGPTAARPATTGAPKSTYVLSERLMNAEVSASPLRSHMSMYIGMIACPTDVMTTAWTYWHRLYAAP